MELSKSGNPTLSERTFKNVRAQNSQSDLMTVNGTLNKFGFTALMLIAGAFFSWQAVSEGASYAKILVWGGLIVGFILALIVIFKPGTAPALVPAYGVMEGLFLGGISATYDFAFAQKMPHIITNAVGLTVGTVVAMYLLYRTGVIKATQRFKSVVFLATAGVAVFYLITMVIRLFGVSLPFMHDSSMLGIGISLLVVVIAALNLIIDFDFIEQGAAAGAPKFMEWYGAFSLMVTIVWLYLEILKLLSRLASRD